ncbi:MAG: hypothetical protein KDJ65_37570 [Anaerolineae bacterium]|nr:hypothetical protein [Anaerolineae bacterium]
MILGCDTGLDITRGLGEVKNAWVTVQNFGTANAHNVHIDLSANDEEASHPDKSVNIGILPPQNQITFKLTVDSGLGFGSEITATADSDETDPISISKTQCRYLDANARELIANAGALGVTVAIQLLK